MIHRHEKSSFVPNAWVFPGGAVDDDDHELSDGSVVNTMRVAAARELFEETGIWLGLTLRDAAEKRRKLLARQVRFGDLFAEAPIDFERLVWTARWITPVGVPRRFDTYFFLACVGRDVVATAEQMLLLAEEKSITVRCDAQRGVEVEGDPSRLKQVVVNLLDNAIRYTSEGGAISVSAAKQNGWATLIVTDNGAGIPPEALPHVFERFYRADKARSRYSGGSGLGLSIVNAICSAHRGEVEIASTEGVGTTVTVRPWPRLCSPVASFSSWVLRFTYSDTGRPRTSRSMRGRPM